MMWIAALLMLVGAHAEDVATPEVPECFLITPSISVGAVKSAAGVGFVVEAGERLLLVTSHQVVGPAGGLKVQLTSDALHKGFTEVVARDAFSGNECARGTQVLAIQGETMGESGKADIAAFELARSKSSIDSVKRGHGTMHPGKLAKLPPVKGDPVFVAAKTGGEKKLLVAKVGEITDGFIFYEFLGKPEVVGTIGGPLLNTKGEVVGIHVGAGAFEDGTVFGSANPLPAVKKALEAKSLPAPAPAAE